MVGFKDYSFGYGFSDNANGGRASLTTIGDSIDETGQVENNGDGGGSFYGTTITENVFILNVSSNIRGAVVLINGQISQYKTPSQIKISKKDLIESGDKTITITKNGYSSNDKYVVSLNSNGADIIKSPFFFGGFGNLTQTDIVIKYYVNDIEQPMAFQSGNSKSLPFTLTNTIKDVEDNLIQNKLTIGLSGIDTGNPIVIRKNGFKQSDIFPTLGVTTYLDNPKTKYKIESSDLTLYRITKITYNSELIKQAPLIAKDDESLSLDITLSSDYSISIEVAEVSKVDPAIPPVIKLLNTDIRNYNINSELGVPIAFEKNSSVEAITIIVGDDILEFDDLEAGNICGVTIPHSVFEKIGKYNINIFPFSLNNYGNDNTLNDVKPIKQISVKPLAKPIFDVVEEVQPIKINPYIKYNKPSTTSLLPIVNSTYGKLDFSGFNLNFGF